MPMATGHPNMRKGCGKEDAVSGNSHAGSDDIEP